MVCLRYFYLSFYWIKCSLHRIENSKSLFVSLKTQLVCLLSSSFETCVVSGLFSRERKGRGGKGRIRADHPQRSQFYSTNLFLSLNLWCKGLFPQKRGKGKAVSVLNVLATGLSLYAKQRVDFVQEMGD